MQDELYKWVIRNKSLGHFKRLCVLLLKASSTLQNMCTPTSKLWPINSIGQVLDLHAKVPSIQYSQRHNNLLVAIRQICICQHDKVYLFRIKNYHSWKFLMNNISANMASWIPFHLAGIFHVVCQYISQYVCRTHFDFLCHIEKCFLILILEYEYIIYIFHGILNTMKSGIKGYMFVEMIYLVCQTHIYIYWSHIILYRYALNNSENHHWIFLSNWLLTRLFIHT